MRLLPFLLLLLSLGVRAQSGPAAGINLEGVPYPAPVRYYAFSGQRQPLRMAYMHERAPRPNGRTVVLLHGKNFNGAYWGRTMRWLLGRGYDVVVPDQIGFGKSTKPEYFQYTFQQLALHTRRLLDTLGVRQVTVLGHSMGGMLATRFALLYPERVERLILLNPIGLEDWQRVVPYQSADDAYRAELAKTPAQTKQYFQANYFHGTWHPRYDSLTAVANAPLGAPAYPRLAWNAALTTELIMTQPVLYEFGRLRVPTALIIGQEDRTALGKNLVRPEVAATMGHYPTLGRAAAKAIPGARLLELAGIGHLPHWEDFAAFTKALADALQ